MNDRPNLVKAQQGAWKAHTGLLQRFPFYAHLMSQVTRHCIDGKQGLVLATIRPALSGKWHLFLNEDAFAPLTPAHQIYVLRKEAGSVMYNAWFRRRDRDRFLWGLACDMRIHGDIDGDDRSLKIPDRMPLPKDIGLGNESDINTIYDTLVELKMKASEDWGHGGDRELSGDLIEYLNSLISQGSESSLVTGSDQAAASFATQQLLSNAIRSTLNDSTLGSEARGYIPAEAVSLLSKLRKQVFDFGPFVRRFMTRHGTSLPTKTWRRPNRRHADMQGKSLGKGADAIIVRDTSGSVSGARSVCWSRRPDGATPKTARDRA